MDIYSLNILNKFFTLYFNVIANIITAIPQGAYLNLTFNYNVNEQKIFNINKLKF